jgi:heme O synthase-like polyprenyltransferase
MAVARSSAYLRVARTRYAAQVSGIVAIFSVRDGFAATKVIPSVASIVLLSMALFFLDDAHDYRSDLIVHPEREIPKGRLKPRDVYMAGVALLSLGVLSASFLSMVQLGVFSAITLLGVAVIFVPMRSTVRSILTASMIWALVLFSHPVFELRTILFGLLVGLPHVGGSIVKDLVHSRGDVEIGLCPPGDHARHVAAVSFFLSIFVAGLLLFLELASWVFAVLILPTIVCSALLGLNVLRRNYEGLYRLGAIGMMSTLAALLFGSK